MRVKTVELEAEQWEQAMLFAHASEVWPRIGGSAPRDSLTANIALFLAASDKADSPQTLMAAAPRVAGER